MQEQNNRTVRGKIVYRRPNDDESPGLIRARALAAVVANRGTGDILPRIIYEDAGVEVPPNATDEFQRNPRAGKKRWFQFWKKKDIFYDLWD